MRGLVREGAALWLGALPLVVAFGSLAALHLGSVAVTAADALVAVGVGSVALAAWREHHWGLDGHDGWSPWWQLCWVLAGLVALMLVSLLWAENRADALKTIAKWSEALAILVAVPRVIRTRRLAWVVVGACCCAALAEAWIGALQVSVLAGQMALVPDRGLRVTGTFGQPNPYAGYLNLALPFALAYVCWGTRRHWRRVMALVAVALVGALWLADSRGAFGGLAAALVAMALAGWPQARRRLVLVGSGGATVLGLMAISVRAALVRWLDAAGWRPLDDQDLSRNVTDANFSTLERLAHWAAAIRMFWSRPWSGVGIGNYADRYGAFAVPLWPHALGHAHNVYLNMAAELGLGGAMLYLGMVAATFWLAMRAVATTAGEGHALALGALGVVAAVAIHQIFDDLTTHNMLIQFALVLALAHALPLIWPAPSRSIC